VIGVHAMNNLAPELGDRKISYDGSAAPKNGEMLLVWGNEQATNDGSTQIKPVVA
jgi:hypothetical protein